MNAGKCARWYCAEGCLTEWKQGTFPCSLCCGYTTRRSRHTTGVKTAHGQPNPRNLP